MSWEPLPALLEFASAGLLPALAPPVSAGALSPDFEPFAVPESLALVAAALYHYRETRRFFVSSFDPALPMYLKDRKALIGDVALGLIAVADFPVNLGISAAANLGLDALCLHTGTLQLHREELRTMDRSVERVIGTAHQAGLEVMVWSPGPAEAGRLAQAGVDALCVNDIAGVQAALSDLC